jgi:predicted nucleotidyltransferase
VKDRKAMGKRNMREELNDDASLKRIVEAVHERNRQAERHLEQKVCEARREVDRLVEEFRAIDPELDRVVLFGSLARDRVESERFDIDLAVRSSRFLQLVARGLRSPFSVDVVELDAVPVPVRKSIDRDGKVLYEKKKR